MSSRWLEGIGAITFDVGGTLIEPFPSVGHIYARVAEANGIAGLDPDALNRRFYERWQQQATTFPFTKPAWATLVAEALRDLGAAANSPALFEAIWQAFLQPGAWRIFDDVRPCLRAVKAQGIRCAVISNWDERLIPTLQNLGLAGEFEFILASAEVGHAKPAPEIFELARRRLGLPAASILHVGDGRREDRDGANAAGWRGVWLDRGAGPGEGVIRRLTDLLD